MARGFERGLGLKVLRLQGQGASFSPQIRAAARRLKDGSGTEADLNTVRDALGIQKSGAGAGKRSLRNASRLMSQAGRVGSLADTAMRGGASGGMAAIGLVQEAGQEVEKLFKNRKFESLLTKSTTKILGKPEVGQRLFYMLGRFARTGNLVIAAAVAGAQIGLARFDATTKRSQRQGAAFDAARANGIDPADFADEAQRVRDDVMAKRGVYRTVKDWLGFDGDTSDDIKAETERRAKLIKAARETPEAFGRSKERLLADYAASQGKTINELNEKERAAALDGVLRKNLNPNDGDTQKRVDTELALQSPWEKAMDSLRGEDSMQAKRREIAQKVLEERVKTFEKRVQDVERASQNAEKKMSPADKQRRRQQIDTADANWNSYRSRHKAWAND